MPQAIIREVPPSLQGIRLDVQQQLTGLRVPVTKNGEEESFFVTRADLLTTLESINRGSAQAAARWLADALCANTQTIALPATSIELIE